MTEIELQGVSKLVPLGRQACARAVDDVSLTIAPGEFFFLLGPSGCGKTTLLRIIAGLIDPTAGEVLLRRARRDRPARREARHGHGLPELRPLAAHDRRPERASSARGCRACRAASAARLAEENLARVQMDDLGGRKPNQLSGGQQQRVALARALAARAAVPAAR